jgi:hypothetical protein
VAAQAQDLPVAYPGSSNRLGTEEEEGVASLMEVPQPKSYRPRSRIEVVDGRHALIEQETSDRQKNKLRGCVQDSLSVTTVF